MPRTYQYLPSHAISLIGLVWAAIQGLSGCQGHVTRDSGGGSFTDIYVNDLTVLAGTAGTLVTTTTAPTGSVDVLDWSADDQTTNAWKSSNDGVRPTCSLGSGNCGTVSAATCSGTPRICTAKYTAPACTQTTCVFRVRATSHGNPALGDLSIVTVTGAGAVVSVAISPTSATVQTNAVQQFTATVSGSGNPAVTWSVVGTNCGNVDSSGLYTAPASIPGGSCSVKATSVADETKSASATLVVRSGAGLLGQGWTGSTSLIDYPKTGPVTTGCPIVAIDDGAGGKTLEGRFLDALALLSDNSCVLIRNNSGAPVMLTAHIHRNTAWASEKRIFAYGTQRITLDGSLIAKVTTENQQLLYFGGAANEHWKGFEITGAPNGNIDVEDSNYMKFEDIWIHHNQDGTGISTYQSSDVVVQDCIYWHNGTVGYQPATNSGDGFASAFGTHCAFVRCVAIHAPDDGFDMYFGDHVKIIDCVAMKAGTYHDGSDAGDGSGFKIGGDAQQGDRCRGGTTIIGSVSLLNSGAGISHWQAHGAARTVSHCTAYDNPYNVGIAPIAGDVVDSNLANTATHADQVIAGTYNHWTSGQDPLFVDTANGDLSLHSDSPCVGAGSGGSTQGASTIALQLLFDNWSRQ